MMGQRHEPMEWEERGEERYRTSHKIRSFTDRLVGSMLTTTDRGSLLGSDAAHKLCGVVSGNSGIEDLCQRQVRNISPSKDGQHDGCGIHQQPGRDSI